jgi:hypothetical protein
MMAWEYRVHLLDLGDPEELEKSLNVLGRDGWEAVPFGTFDRKLLDGEEGIWQTVVFKRSSEKGHDRPHS